MYNVYQHWDPLKVCIVGKSYGPEFYSFITNSRVRNVLERIAIETEDDYQKLIKLLESFNVEILRPDVTKNYQDVFVNQHIKIPPPPMTPRDDSIMLGNNFFFKSHEYISLKEYWQAVRGSDWPDFDNVNSTVISQLPTEITKEIDINLRNRFNISIHNIEKIVKNQLYLTTTPHNTIWGSVLDKIEGNAKIVTSAPVGFSAATSTRIGKDIYIATKYYGQDRENDLNKFKEMYPEYRWHVVDTGGHSDGVFCPVVPGLIVILRDIPTYKDTFPDWEIIYLPNQSYSKIIPFLDLKQKNQGKWWVPGEELNDEFTNFVESWLNHWVGYVEETVFDVNMLVIDEKNVVCNNYNEQVFRAFERYGITPHVINFRHRYFWDGGLHCITSDVHREGVMKDYFPERG